MLYWYKALKKEKLQTGKLEASTQKDVVEYLKNNGYFPVVIKEIEQKEVSIISTLTDRVGFTDIVNLTRQLAIMLNAGLTLIDCFGILEKQIEKRSLLKVVQDIDKEVRGGRTFSTALQKYPQHFSNLYVSLIKSGEKSGKLSEILLRLAENLEKQREFQGKIKGALIYPIIVIIGMISVMFIMITFVIPKLLTLYKDFNIELPVSTQILIIISSFSVRFWPFILAAVFGGFTFFQRYSKTLAGRHMLDSLRLKIPVINNIVKISALVDSTRTLAILVGSGVSILESLDIVVETTGNVVFQDAFRDIYKQVEKGVTIGNAMSSQGIFPPILVQMTTVGEQTGHLDDTLMRISKYFEMESELAVKTMTTLIEPLILVVLGLGVGFLVISVITPIYNLTGSFK